MDANTARSFKFSARPDIEYFANTATFLNDASKELNAFRPAGRRRLVRANLQYLFSGVRHFIDTAGFSDSADVKTKHATNFLILQILCRDAIVAAEYKVDIERFLVSRALTERSCLIELIHGGRTRTTSTPTKYPGRFAEVQEDLFRTLYGR